MDWSQTGFISLRRHRHPSQTVQYGCGQCYISAKRPGYLHLVSKPWLKVKAGERAEFFKNYAILRISKDSKNGLFSEKIVDPDFDRFSKSRKVCMI